MALKQVEIPVFARQHPLNNTSHLPFPRSGRSSAMSFEAAAPLIAQCEQQVTTGFQFCDSESAIRVERVAGRADRTDHVGMTALVQRFAQPPDMNIDGARVDVGIMRPDDVEEPL